MPVDEILSSENLLDLPMVNFGGHRYYIRSKGSLTRPENYSEARIRSYINEDGRLLQNGVKFLEERLSAHYSSERSSSTSQQEPNKVENQKEVQNKGESASGSKEKEKGEKSQKVEAKKTQSAPSDTMTLDEVDAILYEAMRSEHVKASLFKGSNLKLERGALKKWPRTPQFWWMVVDIALAIASSRLLRWAFTSPHKRGEKMGAYAVLPYSDETYKDFYSESWNNQMPARMPLARLVAWFRPRVLNQPGDPFFERDEKLVYGQISSPLPAIGANVSYKEENIVDTVKCLFELRLLYPEADALFHEMPASFLAGALRMCWPPSALSLFIPLLQASNLLFMSESITAVRTYALASPDRLLFAVRYLNFTPNCINPVEALLSKWPEEKAFKTKVLPMIKALAHLASPGWCHVLPPPEIQDSENDYLFSAVIISKRPNLIFEDTAHLYDPKSLKPAPPIFDFFSANIPLGDSVLCRILTLSNSAKDCSPYLTAIKAMVGAGVNIRSPNFVGKLPFSCIENVPAKNASSKELRDWLIKQEANKPLYDTIKITKDTTNSKRQNMSSSSIPPSPNTYHPMPEPICSDDLKYSLIKGDIIAAKKALQDGDCLYPVRNGVHQVSAYTEMMYEIVRQGRMESLKLLHEHGFPLKDVYLRSYLHGCLPLKPSLKDNTTSENPPDLYYRLIIEACKAGNLEMVKYLREVAKSSWSCDFTATLQLHPFWYAIKMDLAQEKDAMQDFFEKTQIGKPRSDQEMMTTIPSLSQSQWLQSYDYLTSPRLNSTAKDYFESILLATNMSDPYGMPVSIYATIIGSLSALEWMATRGWNILNDRYEGASILHFAAACGPSHVWRWVLTYYDQFYEQFASSISTSMVRDDLSRKPMDWAITKNQHDVILALEQFAWTEYCEGSSITMSASKFCAAMNDCSSILRPTLENSLEWADATPGTLKPFRSRLCNSVVYSSFDYHDEIFVKLGLNLIISFTPLTPDDIPTLALPDSIKHLRTPIQDYLTWRDIKLLMMDDTNHNTKRVARWAQTSEKFRARLASEDIPSYRVASDFARRISKPINFEIDLWIMWAFLEVKGQQPPWRHFLTICQLAGLDMLHASVDIYKRVWLEFEPCKIGAVAPLLEIIAANPAPSSPIWTRSRFRRTCRKANIFVAMARASPFHVDPDAAILAGHTNKRKGWGTATPLKEGSETSIYDGNWQNITYPPLIWMFTVLLPSARSVVALVSEVFIEVVFTGSIRMAEWIIDHCEIGNTNMDCYRMMMCHVAVFGSMEMLSWLFHRGFPLSFSDEDAQKLESSERFVTSEKMPEIPSALRWDFYERCQNDFNSKPIRFLLKPSQFEVKLSHRPNFINAVIAIGAKKNSLRAEEICQRVDFLMRNGVPLFEADVHPDGYGWDASHYIAIGGLDILADHLKMKHAIVMPTNKDKNGRTPEDLRKLANEDPESSQKAVASS